VGDLLIVHEMSHCLGGPHLDQACDLVWSTAEAGALQQMRRAFVIPIARADRREITDPRGGGGGAPQGGGGVPHRAPRQTRAPGDERRGQEQGKRFFAMHWRSSLLGEKD